MKLNLEPKTKMTTAFKLIPRLQQAIKVLQYNHLEMVNHVQQAMLENPTLEEVPFSDGGGVSDRELSLREQSSRAQEELVEQRNGDEGSIDWEKVLSRMANEARTSMPTGSFGGTIHNDLPPIETNLTYGESLADHLLFQLRMTRCGEDEGRAAQAIIQNLDPRGYFELSLDELAEELELEPEVVEEALELVQGLDPLGCGARDLSECLIIQAKAHFPEDDTFPRILGEHLGDLERRNYAAIARALKLEHEDVIEYHRMIQDLEPHPGRAFSGEEPRYITPDIVVEKRAGQWEMILNEDGIPDVQVSAYYRELVKRASSEDRKYLLEKLKGASFVVESINKRRRTIRRVMESILTFQMDFFEHGPERLRPLVLQEVADDLGLHMSTISRVTTNKYVHTPHGTFELKYFFSAGVRQQSGEDMAAEAIRTRLRALVAEEDPTKPLSDQAIANALKEEGIKVARRTVAKYREQLGILSSSQRKHMF